MNKQKVLSVYKRFKAKSKKIWSIREKAIKSSGLMKLLYTYQYYKRIKGSYIPLSAVFESPPVFPHGISGIFVSSGAKIGKNAVIFHQVTIGSNTIKDSKAFGAPTIGNNVYIGAGAKIIGNVIIGNNVRIGANCVVVTDVPDNATVVMQKPRVIIREGGSNEFAEFSYEDETE